MQQSFVHDKPKGYVQFTGTGAAFFVSSLVFPHPEAAGQSNAANTAPGIPNGTQMLVIQPEGGTIRMRDDGVAPTSAVGYPVPASTEFRYACASSNIQIYAPAGTVVNVWAFG